MKVHYWKSPQGNVGDDLNDWLWPRVFGPGFFDGTAPEFYGIGSVLDERVERGEKPSIIFGLGRRHANRYAPRADRLDLRFVRGPLTARAMARMGMPGVRFISDPAILTPRYIAARPAKVPGRIGFVPYFATPAALGQRIAAETGMELIPVTLGVEDFVHRLCQCERIVTEAMHGAILADAFRVPWAACRLLSGLTEGRTTLFKWADWAGSLDIPLQMPDTLPWPVYYAPGKIRRKFTGLATARALPVVRGVLRRGRFTLSAEDRLTAAQDAILAEAEKLKAEYA